MGLEAREAANTAGQPPEEVRRWLERVLASPGFAAKRRGQLLRYLVERTLAGEADRITEYAIGLDVFHKPESFDPRVESTIRAEMTRVRKTLADYYANGGSGDGWRFQFAARGYVPALVRAAPPTAPRPRLRWRTWAALAAVAALAVAAWRILPIEPGASVIVLPFANLTGDAGNDYLADGITEGLTDALAHVAALRVVARTSAFQFKGKAVDIREIGRRVDAAMAVEGSLRQVAGGLRVTVQLNRTRDGYHILSKAFDVAASELSALDSTLAAPVLAVLRPGERPPVERPPDPQAWKLLLQAQALSGYGTPDYFNRQVTLLNQAIQQDPAYARAYAELSAVYAAGATNGFLLPLDGAAGARAAAAKAIALDPDSAMAYAAQGYAGAFVETHWKPGEENLRHAVRLMPQSARIHQWLANVLLAQGRFPEALAEARVSAGLDPLTPTAGVAVGMVYFMQRRYDDALASWRDLARAHPDAIALHRAIGLAWEGKGDYAKADAEFKTVAERFPAVVRDDQLLLLALSARQAEARAQLTEFEKTAPDHYFTFAVIEAHLGNRDAAFRWLDRTWDQRGLWLLKVYPFLDPLRGDARYRELLKRVGL